MEFRIAHQGAADGEHLLFAAGEHACRGVGALAKVRKHGEHVCDPPDRTLRILEAERQILPHREARKDIAVLRHIAKAEPSNAIAREPRDLAALEPDRADRRDLADDRLDGGGTPDAVAADEASPPRRRRRRDRRLENMALAVIGVEDRHGEHQCVSSPR